MKPISPLFNLKKLGIGAGALTAVGGCIMGGISYFSGLDPKEIRRIVKETSQELLEIKPLKETQEKTQKEIDGLKKDIEVLKSKPKTVIMSTDDSILGETVSLESFTSHEEVYQALEERVKELEEKNKDAITKQQFEEVTSEVKTLGQELSDLKKANSH